MAIISTTQIVLLDQEVLPSPQLIPTQTAQRQVTKLNFSDTLAGVR